MGLHQGDEQTVTNYPSFCYDRSVISVRTLLSVIALVLLAVCPPASAEDVIITAPSYSAVNNFAGRPITVDSFGWLHGIDYEGEWLEYDFELVAFGVHSSGILVKGTLGAEFHLHMVITGSDSHFLQSLDFNFTGSGFVG